MEGDEQPRRGDVTQAPGLVLRAGGEQRDIRWVREGGASNGHDSEFGPHPEGESQPCGGRV